MIKSLKALYRKQMYLPGILGLFINPFFSHGGDCISPFPISLRCYPGGCWTLGAG